MAANPHGLTIRLKEVKDRILLFDKIKDLITMFKEAEDALRHDLVPRRLTSEETGVIGVNPLSPRSEGPRNKLAIYLWMSLAILLPPIYITLTSEVSETIFNFLVPAWRIERAYAPKAFLHVPTRVD